MIFVDPSGRRWRMVKSYTAGIGGLVLLPVATLVIGSMVYQPGWNPLSPKSWIADEVTAAPEEPAPAVIQPAVPSIPRARLAIAKQPQPVVSPEPQPVPAASTSPSPAVENLPPDTVGAQPDPGNSEYGRAHKPAK